MKFTNYFILISITVICSCNYSNEEQINQIYNVIKSNVDTINNNTTHQLDSIETKTIIKTNYDSIPRFTVDDYPITNTMIRKQSGDYHLFKVNSGKTYSIEKSWFKNDSINQTIVIQLATDYHRFFIYHFDNQNTPPDLILDIGFHTDKGELAKPKDIKNDFQGFIEQSKVINSSFFKSKKGVKIGLSISEAIKIYGEPDAVKKIEGFSKVRWDFIGDEFYNNEDLNGKPLAKNSFGHSVIMYFREHKLVAQELINEIP